MAPEVDVDGEEAVELRAVVHRQGVQLDVVRAHAAVDDAADVLADQRAAGEHHALGAGLGAGGVHQPQRIVVRDRDVRRRVRTGPDPLVHVLPARVPVAAARRAGSRDDGPRCGRRAGGRQGLVGHLGELGRGDHRRRSAVLQDEGDLVDPQHEVDRARARPRSVPSRRRGRRTASSCGSAAPAGPRRRDLARRAWRRRGRPPGRTPRTSTARPRRPPRAWSGTAGRIGSAGRRSRTAGRGPPAQPGWSIRPSSRVPSAHRHTPDGPSGTSRPRRTTDPARYATIEA